MRPNTNKYHFVSALVFALLTGCSQQAGPTAGERGGVGRTAKAVSQCLSCSYNNQPCDDAPQTSESWLYSMFYSGIDHFVHVPATLGQSLTTGCVLHVQPDAPSSSTETASLALELRVNASYVGPFWGGNAWKTITLATADVSPSNRCISRTYTGTLPTEAEVLAMLGGGATWTGINYVYGTPELRWRGKVSSASSGHATMYATVREADGWMRLDDYAEFQRVVGNSR